MKVIKTAIIPVAGRGTRLMPLTKTTPKELLPVYDRPVIDYIVQEACDAGMERIILVINMEKEMIRDQFGGEDIEFVYQDEALGDGHAIAQVLPLLEEGEAVLVLFGDELIDNKGGKNAAEQLIETYKKTKSSVIGLQSVPRAQVSKYGIVKLGPQEGVKRIQEKPSTEEAESTLAIVGKYILSADVLSKLSDTEAHADGEIRLSGTFEQMIKDGEELSACILDGERFDTGSFDGLLAAGNHFSH